MNISVDDTTELRHYHCIIFGQPLQENESSLAVIFIPIFKEDNTMAKAKYKQTAKGYWQTSVWDGTYTDTGKKKYITIRSNKSSKDLENKVIEHNQKLKNRSLVKKTDQTFYDYALMWLNVYKSNRSYNTKRMYQNIIEKHFVSIKSIRLSDISRVHYQYLINLADGKSRTQQQIHLCFKQVIKSAIADQFLPANILSGIFDNVDKIKYNAGEKRTLQIYEKKAVFTASLSPRDKAFLYILYGCGLRRGEALALTKFDVNLERSILTVQHSIYFDVNNPYIKDTKSVNGLRSVPIPSNIRPALADYMKSVKGEKLFPSSSGSWMTKSGYDRMWARILRRLQDACNEPISGLTAHVFRHNYCSNLCYQIPTISIKKIAELMGDTEKVVLDVYNHIIQEKEDAASAVENALNF